MADPELWHAIHRLAVIIKHMDVDDELGVEMDGLLDGLKNWAKDKKQSFREWRLDNKEEPNDDYQIDTMDKYSFYKAKLQTYDADLESTKTLVESNAKELKRVSKIASDTSKANTKRDPAKTEQSRLTQLQKIYESKKTVLTEIVRILKDINLRYKESYNEMMDYKSRVNAAISENGEYQQQLQRLKLEEDLLKTVPAQTQV